MLAEPSGVEKARKSAVDWVHALAWGWVRKSALNLVVAWARAWEVVMVGEWAVASAWKKGEASGSRLELAWERAKAGETARTLDEKWALWLVARSEEKSAHALAVDSVPW